MTQSLRTMAGAAEQIAAGDLRTTITPQSPNDVLGNAFLRMTANLREQTNQLVEGANVLGSAASEIVVSTTQLASSAGESATAVGETTTTVEEVRQTAQVTSQKAKAVSDNAQKAAQISQGGRKSAEDVSSPTPRLLEIKSPPVAIKIIGIGASTGGPPVLQVILAGLPKNFSVPILVVQHIARGFLPGLTEWLNQTTGLQIHVAADGMCPLPGHVYLAPADFHMGVSSISRIRLTREEPENGLRPAVSYLLRSLSQVCGPKALGVLLSGMGKDGARELKLMKDNDAITIAQDRESSVVHGMPGEAIELGGATHVLPADKIADALIMLINRGRAARGIES